MVLPTAGTNLPAVGFKFDENLTAVKFVTTGSNMQQRPAILIGMIHGKSALNRYKYLLSCGFIASLRNEHFEVVKRFVQFFRGLRSKHFYSSCW